MLGSFHLLSCRGICLEHLIQLVSDVIDLFFLFVSSQRNPQLTSFVKGLPTGRLGVLEQLVYLVLHPLLFEHGVHCLAKSFSE